MLTTDKVNMPGIHGVKAEYKSRENGSFSPHHPCVDFLPLLISRLLWKDLAWLPSADLVCDVGCNGVLGS